MKKVEKSEQEWAEQLNPDQFEVARKKGTERPFTGEYHDCKKEGVYHCICCGSPLFSSKTKFDSGTGWPSFWAPIESAGVLEEEDRRRRADFMDRLAFYGLCGGLLFLLCLLVSTMLWWALY